MDEADIQAAKTQGSSHLKKEKNGRNGFNTPENSLPHSPIPFRVRFTGVMLV
jgi:hypothetical protein